MKIEESVKIKCPKCGYVQKAKIKKTFPFYIYIHYCEKCNYVITERFQFLLVRLKGSRNGS